MYQRLLAGDPDEATERAEEYLKSHSILDYYEGVAIPALSMFEHDRARGVLTDERRALVAAAAFTLVDNLSEHEDLSDERGADELVEQELPSERPLPAVIEPGSDWQDRPILCAGGRGNLDDVAAAILAQLLERCGIGSRVASYEAIATATYTSLDMGGVQVVCLSYLNPELDRACTLCVRRLRRRSGVPIAVGFWSHRPERSPSGPTWSPPPARTWPPPRSETLSPRSSNLSQWRPHQSKKCLKNRRSCSATCRWPARFTRALMRAAEVGGAELRVGHVSGVLRDRSGASVVGVEVDGGELFGDAVVIAMGPWSIMATAWLPLPAVFGLKGHSILLIPVRRCRRRPLSRAA